MWQDKAACKNVEDNSIFFSGVASRIEKAKAFCNSCDVVNECLQFAIDNEDFNPHVYGGLTGKERMALVS